MKKYLILGLLVSSSFAKVVDLSEYQTPVKNQKDRNTCAYFAVTAMVESAIKKKFDVEVDISEQYQIYLGKEVYGENPNDEFGDTYKILDNFIKQTYTFQESQIPYQLSFFENNGPCSDQDPFSQNSDSFCFSQAPLSTEGLSKLKYSGLKKSWVTGMWSGKDRVGQVIEQLDQGRSVVVTMKVYAPLWNNDGTTHFDSKVDEKCESGEYACYGHAILITGYDDEAKVFKFKNSWSTDWGVQGYGSLSFDYVRDYSFDPLSAYFDRFGSDLNL